MFNIALQVKFKVFAGIFSVLRALFNAFPSVAQISIINAHYSIKNKRFRLVDEGHFPLPEGVFFELRTKCSGRCSFCAASIQNETRPDAVMEFSLYNKVVNELADLNYSGRVAFHVNNEPLIVPDLEKYIVHARKKLPRAWIQILTNGRSLSLRRAESLMKVKVNEITVNHYNDDDYIKQNIPSRLVTVRDEVISKYYPPKYIQRGHGPGNSSEENIFRYNIYLRRENEILTNRAGTAPNKEELIGENILGYCEYPFIQLNITTDGRVSQCCADLYFEYSMGNLKEKTVSEIWFGKEFQAARKALLANDRNGHPMCKTCDFVGVKGRFFPKLIA